MSLKQKTISGLAWSFIESLAQQGVGLLIGIILARLLSPKEFGLIGMTAIFLALSQTFVDSGFSQALVRKSDCGQKDYSTVFYFNLAVGIFCYALLFILAGPISRFFNEPQLTLLIRVLALNIVIISLSLIQGAILIKKVDFKRKAKITVAASIISGVIGVTMAYWGWGVWSIVWQIVSQNIISAGLLWLTGNWRPALLFDLASFREMYKFGSKLLASGLIDTIYRNIYYLVIGKYFSAAELGYYTRADSFQKIPSTNLSNIVGRVAYPVLAIVKDEQAKLKAGYKKLIKSTMLISFVLMLGMAAAARPMVLALIGEKWLLCVPYLQLLCLVGMFYPLHALNLDMLNVKGRSDLFLKLEVIKKILVVPIIVIGVFYGIKAMIIGMLVNTLIAYYLNSYWSGKMVDYPMKEQVLDILPSFLLAVAMSGLVFAIGHFTHLKPVLLFAVQVLAGAIFTVVLAQWLKLEAFMDMRVVVTEQWARQIKAKS